MCGLVLIVRMLPFRQQLILWEMVHLLFLMVWIIVGMEMVFGYKLLSSMFLI